MKKLLAILAATAVLASATLVTTSTIAMTADAVTVTITNAVDGESVKQSYEFYQIFAGTVVKSASGNVGIGKMTDIVWGSAISDGSGFISDLRSAFTESEEFDNCETAAAVAAVIEEFTAEQIDELAVAIADYMTKKEVTATTTTTTTTTTSGNVITADISSSGYYLIVDKSESENSGLGDEEKDEYDISKHMLAVINADDTTMKIITKNEKPSLVKKVCENSVTKDSEDFTDLSYQDDTGYNDIADYCIGDKVPFKLYATLPTTFDGFETYYLCFHDKLANGFTFDSSSVEVTLRVGEPGNYTDYPISSDYNNYTVSEPLDDCTFDVAFNDILKIDLPSTTSWEEVAAAGAEIIVSYDATLTEDAVIGLSGQENQACLEYSNNANHEATGENGYTGFTPWDKVIVFTYELDINKVSSADLSLLSGAQFMLQNSKGEYAVLDPVSDDKDVDEYKLTEWTSDSSSGTTIETTGVTVKIKGLDDGTYSLIEKEAPSGYDKAGPWELTIASDHDRITGGNQNGQKEWSGSADEALVSLTLTVDDGDSVEGNISDGYVTATIENRSDVDLPTTGGIGTTIFYVAGGVLVVGAGVLLISRKRSRS